MKSVYPVVAGVSRLFGSKSKWLVNENNALPHSSIYQLSFADNTGTMSSLAKYKGKKILLVNTASDCGFTGQFDELQKLSSEYSGRLVVMGFPANDFAGQEQLDDKEIAGFCRLNYGVSFPLAKKSVVIKSPQQNTIFKWLTDASMNGWNNQQPEWNFSKYLINERGGLMAYFGPAISPLDEKVVKMIEK